MTLIVGWIGCDEKKGGKKPASLYFGSDSCISVDKNHRYLYGKKLYSCRLHPEIFAFCGSVSFPMSILPPLIEQIDAGLFFLTKQAADKVKKIADYLQEACNSYSALQPNYDFNSQTILYGTKEHTTFHVHRFSFHSGIVSYQELPLYDHSSIIAISGSGKNMFTSQKGSPDVGRELYSREICYYLSSTIYNSDNYSVGGIPQIVGIYRGKPTPVCYGFVKDGKRYFFGREVTKTEHLDGIEWRNQDFERIDPYTLKLLEGAQAQPFIP